LFKLLQQNLRSKAREKIGYDAFRLLVEKDVSGAVQQFAEAIRSVPPDVIPPAVGMDLATLSQAKPEAAKTLEPVLKRLQETDTRAGVAAKKGKSPKRP
jgi:hypothetical protein